MRTSAATTIRFETLPIRQVVRSVAPYLGLNAVLCLGLLTLIVQRVRVGHLPSLRVLALVGVALMLAYVVTKVFFTEIDAARRQGHVVRT